MDVRHPIRLLILSRFDALGASSRLRSLQYIPYLREAGIHVRVSFLFTNGMLAKRYRRRGYSFQDLLVSYWRRFNILLSCASYDVVLIEKEALPWLPAWVELCLLRKARFILDFDDAQFHRYDSHYSWVIRMLFSRKFDHLVPRAHLIVAGNNYISNYCVNLGARRVEILPTVVDLNRYRVKNYGVGLDPLRIVWIGTPETIHLLKSIVDALTALAKRKNFTLRVIGGGAIDVPGVTVEVFAWNEETENALIADCDIGVMPLSDAPWDRGKCAYKLIQYMASGLPVVASPVGANCDVVVDNGCGFFASSAAEWTDQLELLLTNAELRQRLGRAGRVRVQENYCLQATGPQLVAKIQRAASR
jgi:glycosyltransferase involved in cell wall biosynthesis